jgi:hypothetical protein
MSASKPVRVSVDLSPLQRGTVACDGILEFGTLDRPDELSIVIVGLRADQINAIIQAHLKVSEIFGSTTATGKLTEHSVTFTAELSFVRGIQFGANQITLNCLLNDYSESSPSAVGACRFWKFRLTNYRVSIGDAVTYQPPAIDTVSPEKIAEYQQLIVDWHREFGQPAPSLEEIGRKYKDFKVKGGFSRNRITFKFGGRQWLLDDDLFDRWPARLDKIAQSIVSGTLACEKIEGDDATHIRQLVKNISLLLTFALGRDIKWVSYGCFSDEGRANEI